jgi:hypothetical protein
MADQKISQLTAATTPLAGTEVLPIVQSSTTKKVAVSDLTAGRAVSAAQLDVDNVRIDGNTVSTTDTNGNLTFTPNGTGIVVSSSEMTINGVTAGKGRLSETNSTVFGRGAAAALQTGAIQMTAIGALAAAATTTGRRQTAIGYSALASNTIGDQNVAVGINSLVSNSSGGTNTAVGDSALFNSSTGGANTAVGYSAGSGITTNNFYNVFIGQSAGSTLVSGNNNAFFGYNAQPSATTVSNQFTYGDANVTVHRFTAGNISLVAAGASLVFTGNSGVIWRTGAGTPEGAVTAPVGSLFTRTDGGANTTLYIKESGVGNTGWVAK